MRKLLFFFIFFSFFYISGSFLAYADLLITKTTVLKDELDFDGIWTHPNEWKPTSQTKIETENGSIFLRYAHQEDFVYFLIDVVADKNPEKHVDKATICIDTKNDKTVLPNENDYCFIAVLGKEQGHTIQGGSFVSTQNYYKKIQNHNDFIAIGNASNENDRYSKIPHSTYEFRIPTDVITRSNIYGIYVGIFDKSQSITYSWPETTSHYTKIPSPSSWGNLVSPDKSLPEFNIPFFSIIIGFTIIMLYFQVKSRFLNNQILKF